MNTFPTHTCTERIRRTFRRTHRTLLAMALAAVLGVGHTMVTSVVLPSASSAVVGTRTFDSRLDPTHPVIDKTGALSTEQIQQMNAPLADVSARRGVSLQVVVIDRAAPEWAGNWGHKFLKQNGAGPDDKTALLLIELDPQGTGDKNATPEASFHSLNMHYLGTVEGSEIRNKTINPLLEKRDFTGIAQAMAKAFDNSTGYPDKYNIQPAPQTATPTPSPTPSPTVAGQSVIKTELNPEDPVFSLTSYSLTDPKLWPELISFNKNDDAQLYVVLLTKPENPSDLQEWGKEFLRVNNAPAHTAVLVCQGDRTRDDPRKCLVTTNDSSFISDDVLHKINNDYIKEKSNHNDLGVIIRAALEGIRKESLDAKTKAAPKESNGFLDTVLVFLIIGLFIAFICAAIIGFGNFIIKVYRGLSRIFAGTPKSNTLEDSDKPDQSRTNIPNIDKLAIENWEKYSLNE